MKNLFGHDIGASSAHLLIGAAFEGPKHASELLSIDENGELWKLAPREGRCDRKTLVRWCIDRGVLAYGDLRALEFGLQRRACVGLLSTLAPRVAKRWRSV